MQYHNSPTQDLDQCWRCDERAIALDEKQRPLCARHAMIFLSAPRLIEARKRAEDDADNQDSATDDVKSDTVSPNGRDMASRVAGEPSPTGEEALEVPDRRRNSIEISLSLYRTHPDQTKQLLEQRSNAAKGDDDLSVQSTPNDPTTRPVVQSNGTAAADLDTEEPVLSPGDDGSAFDNPPTPAVEPVTRAPSLNGEKVETPARIVSDSENVEADAPSDSRELDEERPPIWKVQPRDVQITRPASDTVCSYSDRPLPSSARRLMGRAN